MFQFNSILQGLKWGRMLMVKICLQSVPYFGVVTVSSVTVKASQQC